MQLEAHATDAIYASCLYLKRYTANGCMFDVEHQDREPIMPNRAEHFARQPNVFVLCIEPPGGSPNLIACGSPIVAKFGDTPP